MKIEPIKVVEKPWGRETWFSLTKDYCFKEIIIYMGCKTSLQYHEQKEETNLIIDGYARVTVQDPLTKEYVISEARQGEVFHFKPGQVHRFEAIYGQSLVMHECSSCQVDDVVRIEDSYGREGTSTP